MDIITRQKLNLLIQLAKADKHFAREEKLLIKSIASKHGFPESELNKLFTVPETIESLGALSTDKKKEYLLDCMALIMADGKIEPREVTFAQNIALKLGFHKDVVNYLLDNWDKADQFDLTPWKV
ncbi:MAG: TerB family tellurite resistance protein [Bacteroidetes bacterium]|nr:TerB family tellurite resistance protein [Bacteroidota bacterium]